MAQRLPRVSTLAARHVAVLPHHRNTYSKPTHGVVGMVVLDSVADRSAGILDSPAAVWLGLLCLFPHQLLQKSIIHGCRWSGSGWNTAPEGSKLKNGWRCGKQKNNSEHGMLLSQLHLSVHQHLARGLHGHPVSLVLLLKTWLRQGTLAMTLMWWSQIVSGALWSQRVWD